ncbi:MAG: prephenate dehydrogenase [Nevskiales bacterium]
MKLRIKRLAVIGVGLIGGSAARALRAAGVVDEIVGCGRQLETLEQARTLGVVDHFSTDPAAAVRGADLILLGMPVTAIADCYAALLPGLAAAAVVTDVGSTKASVIASVAAKLGELPPNFVPGHPIAGTERSGVEASSAALFQQRRVILTPEKATDVAAIAKVRALWESCGARVTTMSAAHHDEVLAATSHLPHLLAFALVDCLAAMEERSEIFTYAAGGFRDFTRIASSNPAMWADIAGANRTSLLRALERFDATVQGLRAALEQGDRTQLLESFSRAKAARDRFAQMIGPGNGLDRAAE